MKYVLNYCSRVRNGHTEVLLLLKDRPAWQAGRLNLPGGKVEPDEAPLDTALRELKEETGLVARFSEQVGVMRAEDHHEIFIFRMWLAPQDERLEPRQGETEQPIWMPISEAIRDARLIPNLRTIIPMTECGVTNYTILDGAKSDYGKEHSFAITVPTSY